MSKKKTQADEERLTLYEQARDATLDVVQKNRKLYEFVAYAGMMGTLICLLYGATRYAFVCMLISQLMMSISLISRMKESILNSMVSEDQMDKFFRKGK